MALFAEEEKHSWETPGTVPTLDGSMTLLPTKIKHEIGDRVRIENKLMYHTIHCHNEPRQLPQLATIVDIDDDDNKPIIKFHDDKYKIKLQNHQRAVPLIKAWLSMKIRLDEFNNKQQTFVITAWINVFWRIHDDDESRLDTICSPTAARNKSGSKTLSHLKQFADKTTVPTTPSSSNPLSPSAITHQRSENMICYYNNLHQKIVKIIDLSKSSLSYYLPIDATKIFCETSLQSIEHNSPPCLYYNQETKLLHTQYHIKAELFQCLNLYEFPFDRQFLNLKLRWNTMYYHLLNWSSDTEIKLPIKEGWFDEDNCMILSERRKILYHSHPLRIHLAESLRSEINLLEPWIDFRCKNFQVNKQESNENDIDPARFALIRLRIKRNPTRFVLSVLVPFFIIVSCSFSVFALEFSNLDEQLEISIIILLTFTAFQSIVDEELPKTSDTELIDKYILIAYIIQGSIILGLCLFPTYIESFVDNHDLVNEIEKVWKFTLGVIWISYSIYYVSKARNIYCNGSKFAFWNKRARKEIENWISTDTVITKFYNMETTYESNNTHKYSTQYQSTKTAIYQNGYERFGS